jgi:hypothetical protein
VFFFLDIPAGLIANAEDSDDDGEDLDLVRRQAAQAAGLAAVAKPMDVDDEPEADLVPSAAMSSLALAVAGKPKLAEPVLSQTLLNLIVPTIKEELKHTKKWDTPDEYLEAVLGWALKQVSKEGQFDQFTYDSAVENTVRDEVQRWAKEGVEARAEDSRETNGFKSKGPKKRTQADRKEKLTGLASAAELKAERKEKNDAKAKVKKERRANKNRKNLANAGSSIDDEEPDTSMTFKGQLIKM